MAEGIIFKCFKEVIIPHLTNGIEHLAAILFVKNNISLNGTHRASIHFVVYILWCTVQFT